MRPSTPFQPRATGGGTITVHRMCNGCGSDLGDANVDDIQAAVTGQPLPDVRDECPLCRWRARLDLGGADARRYTVPRDELTWLIAQIDDARAYAAKLCEQLAGRHS